MTVTLNIASDQELRDYIKDLVKGQILAITREEVSEIVKEEVNRKLKGKDEQALDRMIQEGLKSAIKDELRTNYGITGWSLGVIKPWVEEVMSTTVSHASWSELVKGIAKKAVENTIAKKLAE